MARWEMDRRNLNSSYLSQFGTWRDDRHSEELEQRGAVKVKREWSEELARVEGRDPLHLAQPSRQGRPGRRGWGRAAREGVWRRLAGEKEMGSVKKKEETEEDEEEMEDEDAEEDAEDELAELGLVPGFPALPLDRLLVEGNRHTKAMLGIMLGEGEARGVEEVARVVVGQVREEEQATLPMDSFWDDLGVGAPYSQAKAGREEEVEEEYQL